MCVDVSVICVSYNHKAFIENALSGIVEQKTRFKYEVIVYDDASSDGTDELIRKFAEKYSHTVFPILSRENLYSQGRSCFHEIIFPKCNGKYLAFCEGDDVWIDPYKLDRQIQYMENHDNCTLTAHNAAVANLRDASFSPAQRFCDRDEFDLDMEEILLFHSGMRLTTASVVVRRKTALEIPAEWMSHGYGDLFVHFVAALRGEVHYFNRIMSVYRLFAPGAWTDRIVLNYKERIKHFFNLLDSYRLMNSFSKGVYKDIFIMSIQKEAVLILGLCKEIGDMSLSDVLEELSDSAIMTDREELLRLVRTVTDSQYLDESIKKALSDGDKIMIYGAGQYADVLSKKIIDSGFDFDGYIVTTGRKNTDNKNGKRVLDIHEYAASHMKATIIAAVSGTEWNNIKKAAEDAGVKEDIIYPFMFHVVL